MFCEISVTFSVEKAVLKGSGSVSEVTITLDKCILLIITILLMDQVKLNAHSCIEFAA